jgi:hypothetical protein
MVFVGYGRDEGLPLRGDSTRKGELSSGCLIPSLDMGLGSLYTFLPTEIQQKVYPWGVCHWSHTASAGSSCAGEGT